MPTKRNTRWNDDLGMLRMRWILASIVAIVAMFIVAIGLIAYQVDRSNCHGFAEKTHRTTRFVMYNLVTWDCLTPTREGRWISTDQLREVDR